MNRIKIDSENIAVSVEEGRRDKGEFRSEKLEFRRRIATLIINARAVTNSPPWRGRGGFFG